jgi:hypothetical protein
MLMLQTATGASQAAGRVIQLLQRMWPLYSGQDEEELHDRHVYFVRSTK